MILNETYPLANGVQIPKLGLGTWFIDDAKAAEAVRAAVKLGYRLIDTAQAYGNERGVGGGVRTCGVHREALFVASKVAAELKTYDGDYDTVVNQGQRENAKGYCPELKPLHIDWKAYNTIILGSPVWWYTFAPAMHSFLKQTDLTGKIVYPFATNGGWLGHTLKDFEKACKGAIVKPGLGVQFDESTLRTPEKEIQTWIKTMHA